MLRSDRVGWGPMILRLWTTWFVGWLVGSNWLSLDTIDTHFALPTFNLYFDTTNYLQILILILCHCTWFKRAGPLENRECPE